MATIKESFQSSKEALDELTRARDEARIQIHLLSMEAADRFRELEANLDTLERKVEEGGEKAAEAVSGRVREVTQNVRDFLKRHARRPSELSLPVSSLMSSDVRCCSPEDSLSRAAQVLWESDCGVVPVVAADRTLLGVVTDRDICMAAYTRGQALAALSVASVISGSVYACNAEDTLDRALTIMRERQIRRVPVTTAEGKLAGIISLADIARWARSVRTGHVLAAVAVASTLARVCERGSAAPAGTPTPVTH